MVVGGANVAHLVLLEVSRSRWSLLVRYLISKFVAEQDRQR